MSSESALRTERLTNHKVVNLEEQRQAYEDEKETAAWEVGVPRHMQCHSNELVE